MAGGARRRDGRPFSKDDFFGIPGRDPSPFARRGVLQTSWATWDAERNRPTTGTHGDVPHVQQHVGKPGELFVNECVHDEAVGHEKGRETGRETSRETGRETGRETDHETGGETGDETGDETGHPKEGHETVGQESVSVAHVQIHNDKQIHETVCDEARGISYQHDDVSSSTHQHVQVSTYHNETGSESATVTASFIADSLSASELDDLDEQASASAQTLPPGSTTKQEFANVAYDDVFSNDSPSTGSIFRPAMMQDLDQGDDCGWSNIAAAILGQDPREVDEGRGKVELTEMCTQDRAGVIRYVPIIISHGVNEDTQTITPLARPITSTPRLSRRDRFDQISLMGKGSGDSKPDGSKGGKKSSCQQSKSAPPSNESNGRSLRKRETKKKYK